MAINPMWIMAALQAAGMAKDWFGGGDEYEAPEWYERRLPEWMRPEYMVGRPGGWESYMYQPYAWAGGEGVPLPAPLQQAYGLYGGMAEAMQRGEVPPYLAELAETIRRPAVAELEAALPPALTAAGEFTAGRGLQTAGGAGQAQMRNIINEYLRQRTGLESGLAGQMYGQAAGLYGQVPGWLAGLGQMYPQQAAQYQAPFEQWYTPGVAGFVGQPAAAGTTGGGADLSQLGYLLSQFGKGQTTTTTPPTTPTTTDVYGGLSPTDIWGGEKPFDIYRNYPYLSY